MGKKSKEVVVEEFEEPVQNKEKKKKKKDKQKKYLEEEESQQNKDQNQIEEEYDQLDHQEHRSKKDKKKKKQKHVEIQDVEQNQDQVEIEQVDHEQNVKKNKKEKKKLKEQQQNEAIENLQQNQETENKKKNKKKDKKQKQNAIQEEEQQYQEEIPVQNDLNRVRKNKIIKLIDNNSQNESVSTQKVAEYTNENNSKNQQKNQQKVKENKNKDISKSSQKFQDNINKKRLKSNMESSDDDESEDEVEKLKNQAKKQVKKESFDQKSTIETNQTKVTQETNENKESKETKVYPPSEPKICDTSLLLFYAYVKPVWTKAQQDDAINYCYKSLSKNGCTGRLRVAREGLNSTLTGKYQGIRNFIEDLKKYSPSNFGHVDFKIVDNLPQNNMLNGLKVWPVSEMVTYGFSIKDAPLELTGTHLKPQEWHEMIEKEDVVVVDVRNYNEALIGRFDPPGSEEKYLNPCMRRSTEFPEWVDKNRKKFEGKKVMMYCTAGVRCERASALLRQKGIQDVYQLEGGIHRYLDAYPEDGGHWVGKNYVFDKRYMHGAKESQVVSRCLHCNEPWERYQAQKKCVHCKMEVLICRTCERGGLVKGVTLICDLCKKGNIPNKNKQFVYENKL